jgi:hypothetical protein
MSGLVARGVGLVGCLAVTAIHVIYTEDIG